MLGAYADRKGRKAALNLTIRLMAVSTGLIAIAPTYARIGARGAFADERRVRSQWARA